MSRQRESIKRKFLKELDRMPREYDHGLQFMRPNPDDPALLPMMHIGIDTEDTDVYVHSGTDLKTGAALRTRTVYRNGRQVNHDTQISEWLKPWSLLHENPSYGNRVHQKRTYALYHAVLVREGLAEPVDDWKFPLLQGAISAIVRSSDSQAPSVTHSEASEHEDPSPTECATNEHVRSEGPGKRPLRLILMSQANGSPKKAKLSHGFQTPTKTTNLLEEGNGRVSTTRQLRNIEMTGNFDTSGGEIVDTSKDSAQDFRMHTRPRDQTTLNKVMSGRDDVIATLKKENRQLRFQLVEVTEEKDDTIAALANENQQLKDQYQEMMQKYADLKTEYQGLNRVQDRTARPGTFELTAQATQEAEKVLGFVKELTCTVDARPTPEIDPDTLDLHAKDLIDSFEPFMRTMQAQEDWIKIAQPVVESAQKHLPLILQQMEKVQAILHEHQQHLRRGEAFVKELTNRLNTWKAAGLQLRTLMSSVEDANADARK